MKTYMHCATFVRWVACLSSWAWSTGPFSSPGKRFSDSKSRLANDKASGHRHGHRKCTFDRLSQLLYESRGRKAGIRSCFWEEKSYEWVFLLNFFGGIDRGLSQSSKRHRSNSRVNEAPFHRLQIQAVNIARKLINHLLEPSKNVHSWADDAGGVTVARSRQTSADLRRFPFKGSRIKTKQNITNLPTETNFSFNCDARPDKLHNSPSHRSVHRKCKLCFRMQRPCVLQFQYFGEKKKTKS